MRRENEFTAEKVKVILEKKGINVNLAQAHTICEFVKLIADIGVNQYLRSSFKKY